MSLCCFPSFRRSGQKKAQSEICVCGRRNPNKPHRRLPSVSGRRTRRVTVGIPGKEYPSQTLTWVPVVKAHTSYTSSQSSNKGSVEELADRFTDALNGYKGQVRRARKTVQCQTESSKEDIVEELVNVFNYSTSLDPAKVHQATNTIQVLTQAGLEDLYTHKPKTTWQCSEGRLNSGDSQRPSHNSP